MINKEIKEALKTLNIPVIYAKTSTRYDKYIIFSYYNETESDKADNTNLSVDYYITMNYWTSNPEDIILYKTIVKLLKENGFKYNGSNDVIDGEYFGKNIDFIYNELKGE